MSINHSKNSFIEFSLGAESYAVPLMLVREVISVPQTTPIPNSTAHFLGIFNLRGDIISVVDLRLKLKTKKATDIKKEEAVIIINAGNMNIGLMVDSINKVLTFSADEVSETPDIQSQVDLEFISGIYKKENELVLLLDIEKILDVKEAKDMTTFARAA